nr:UDP binding domain-containing protein [Geomicrobium sp. JCM 19039]
MNMAGARDYVPVMLQAADEVNVRQRHRPIQHLDTHFNEELEGKTVAVLGLAFKPNTDDMRDAPSIDIIHDLTKRGAHIRAHDPIASEAAAPLLPRSVHLATSAQDAYTGADAVIIVTEWDEYKALTPAQLTAHMQGNVLIDGRNALDFAAYKDAGFDYYGIGRS